MAEAEGTGAAAVIAVAVLAWLVFAIWPPGLEAAIGRKRVFLNAVLNGITLGAFEFNDAYSFGGGHIKPALHIA
jgi:hypothetical protein